MQVLQRILFWWTAVLALAVAAPLQGQYTTVFEGHPTRKIETSPEGATEFSMTPEESDEFLARVVVDREGNYFWASREMRPMVRLVSGSYVTYATTTSYIRTYIDAVIDLKRLTPSESAWGPYEYVEHIYVQFVGVNYYGNRVDR